MCIVNIKRVYAINKNKVSIIWYNNMAIHCTSNLSLMQWISAKNISNGILLLV